MTQVMNLIQRQIKIVHHINLSRRGPRRSDEPATENTTPAEVWPALRPPVCLAGARVARFSVKVCIFQVKRETRGEADVS
ncbi:MAG: hypothetical protein ACLPSW_06935 [Roseiarcus sp.]